MFLLEMQVQTVTYYLEETQDNNITGRHKFLDFNNWCNRFGRVSRPLKQPVDDFDTSKTTWEFTSIN